MSEKDVYFHKFIGILFMADSLFFHCLPHFFTGACSGCAALFISLYIWGLARQLT